MMKIGPVGIQQCFQDSMANISQSMGQDSGRAMHYLTDVTQVMKHQMTQVTYKSDHPWHASYTWCKLFFCLMLKASQNVLEEYRMQQEF
jgi:predicted DNA-binding ArsR family transcriptional regulator